MNIKILKLISAMAVVLFLLSACISLPRSGSGRLVTETRDVSNFDSVDLSGAGQLEIIQDGSESLLIETNDYLIEHITTEVRGGTLYVGFDFDTPISLLPTEIKFTLHVRNLEQISVSGAWEIACDSLEADRLSLEINGAGRVRLKDLRAEVLNASLGGAGQIVIAGQVDSQDVEINGAGQYQADDLQSETATVSISGTGQATVWASERLTVETSGAGLVEYYGSPQVVFDRSGAGEIRSLGEK